MDNKDYEEYYTYKKRIRDEFAYLANKIPASNDFLIGDILVEVVRDILDLERDSLNHGMMQVIDKALEGVCVSVKNSEIYPSYISSLLHRIEMAKYTSRN